jgi:pimeloyl-ACP methyl ester carboxylesterase
MVLHDKSPMKFMPADHFIHVGPHRTRYWQAGERGPVVVLRGLLPKVEVQVWDHCGHMPQIEMAERFNDTVMRFWGRH